MSGIIHISIDTVSINIKLIKMTKKLFITKVLVNKFQCHFLNLFEVLVII